MYIFISTEEGRTGARYFKGRGLSVVYSVT